MIEVQGLTKRYGAWDDINSDDSLVGLLGHKTGYVGVITNL